jgi:hypothetical protein
MTGLDRVKEVVGLRKTRAADDSKATEALWKQVTRA